MIEPDINERMARFAPSQRGSFMQKIMEGAATPEQRDIEYPSMPDYTGAKIAEDVAAMAELSEPAAPVRPMQSSPIAEDIAEQARQNLNASLVGVRTVNPDEAAKAMRLGRQLDLPPEVVRADMRRAEEQEYLDRLRSRDILRNDPVLANYLANREFANIAHDDIDNLTAIERTFKFFRDIPSGVSEGFTKAVSQAEMADIIERQRQRGGYLEEYEKAALQSYNRELAALSVETGLAEAGSYLFSQQLTGWKQEDIDIVLAGGVIGGGAGLVGGPLAPATVPAGMALGLKAGLSTALVNRSLRMERALLYAELEPELGNDLANQIATGVGVLNASLDVGALGIVTKPLREPFKAAFRQSVKEAVKKQTVRQAFGRFGLWYAGSAATEVGTETLQELNNVLGMELGLYLQDKPLVLTTEEGRAEVADRLANIAAETALGMVTVGLPGPALQFYTDVRKSAKATRDHKMLENITKTVAESKVLPRDAATMEQYLASTAAGTDAETTYIDAAVAHDILRQSGLTELEMDAVLPGVRQQIEQYQSDGITLVGADVTIPTAQFAARLAKTPLQAQLLPHARLSADAPSLVEAQRIRAEHDQRRAEAEQIIAQQEATNGTFVQEAREIEDTLASQIQATGQMDERAARSSAQFMRDFYVTQAASMGLTPKQVYERFPVRVEGEGMAAPLEQAAMPLGPNAPSIGVAQENKLGFWPALRVMATQAQELPEKPLILTGTTNKNAAKQLSNVDDILGRFPDAGASVDAWTNMLSYAFATSDVPVPPYAFIRDINGNGSFERLSTLTEGQIADASRGFANAREFRQAYINGELDVITTGKLFLWSFLSRGVSPYTQESLFIDAFEGADSWIKKAAQGDFTEADFPAYEKWAKSVAPQGSGQPGAGATHNLNAFGKNFLMKMGAIGPDGKSNLQRLHEMMSDPNQTGQKIRREFSTFGEGVGIDNKVVSFTLLVAGFNDVMVLDRVQIRQLWDDGRFAGTNLYDGVMSEDGKKLAGSSLNAITEGVRGILVYEAIERQLAGRVNELYARLGRPEDASIGRYHWETWVAYSQQEAAHATLDAILLDAKGDDQAIAKVSGKQGEYGAYEYGAQYNRDRDGIPWFRYVTPLGGTYDFSVASFRQFLSEIKKAGNKVVPAKFKVSESGNAPWYTRPEVNRQRLEEQAAKWADRGGGTGEGARLAEQAAADADAIRARSGAGVQPAVGVGVLEQAAPGPARGGFDPRRLTTILNKTADLSTFLHESAHAFLTFYEQVAQMPDAPARIVNDLDEVLRWAGIAGDTPQARLAAWNGMTLDQKRKAHEQFAYSFEVYLFEGKAPSAEMQGLFERFSAWLKRVYRSIRDDLNAIYRREFGEDLPILTGEVRQVMDRMLATDEQIARQAAINEMKPMFQTREEAMAFGMPEAEWAAFQQMQQEAIEASVIDMNVASMRQMQWLGNARSRVLREVQKKHDARRKEVAAEMAAEVRLEPVYRAMTYLRTGKFIDAEGNEIDAERDVVSASLMELARSMGGAEVEVQKTHRLDMKKVRAMYAGLPSAEDVEVIRATGMAVPTNVRPDIAKLGTGKGGMMGLDGLDPDLVAETFGYSSGDEMIRALVAARPMKEIVAERTDAEMLRRFGDMNTPEAVEAEVQAALHNEARARMVAVQLRFVSKATEPARVMVDAAKQVARDLIAAKRVRDVRPSDFVAAEARAARDSEYLVKYEAQPKIAGRAEYDRVYNLALSAGSTEEGAITAATAAQEAFVATQRALRAEEFRARFGPTTPQEALIRAQRAQLYQNQLAAEALRVKAEVDKQVKYLRRVLRDENVKRMGADATDQVRAILDNYSLVSMTRAQREQVTDLRNWLAAEEANGTLVDIDPSLADSARRKNYTELTVEQFRDLVDSVKLIEYRGKNERNIYLAGQKLVFEEMRDGVVASMTEVAEKKGRKVRKDLGDEDRKWMNTIASYDASQQTIANIVYVLDGGKRDGPLARALIMPANDAGNQEAADRAAVSEKVNDIVGPLAKKGQFAAPKMHFPHIGESLSLEQRMVIALNYGNQSNIDRLLNGEQWTADQARVIIESLTEEQLQAVQAIWDVMSSFRDRVAEKSRRLTGKEPRWLEPLPMSVTSADGRTVELRGGYYPAKYNPRRSVGARELDIAADAERLQREAYTATTTSRSFEKNRSDKPPVDQVLSRQFVAMYAGLNEVIHDLAWHDFAIAATKLLRDKSFQRVIKERYGLETYNSIKDWVDVVVAGDRTKYDAFEQVAIFARQNVSVSAMGIRLMTAAVQPTGIFPAMTRVGIGPMVRAIAEFAYSPVQTSRNVLSRSSFMQSRGRTRFRDLNEIQNIVQEQSRFQRVRRTYIASAYVLTSFTQGLVDTSVWMAAYSNAIKAGKSEKDAVFVADQTVIDTQGSGRVQDLSSAMRGGKKQSAYAKLFTPFYQYSNTMYSLFGAQMRTAPTYGKAAKDALLIMTVGAIVEELIRHALKPSQDEIEPEELAKKLAANQIDFVVGLPFGLREFRGAGSLIMGTEDGVQSYRGPSGLRIVTDATQAAVQARQGEFDAAFRRAVINLLGTTAGIPSAQINDTITGIEAVVEGEVEGAEAVLAPVTGVRR